MRELIDNHAPAAATDAPDTAVRGQAPQLAAAPDLSATQVVYVVTGELKGSNARARSVAWLRDRYEKVVHCFPGPVQTTDRELITPAWPNPIAVLKHLGLNRWKLKLDRLILFPSNQILFVHAVKRKLLRAIRADLAQGRKVAVMVTAPPHATTALGLYLKRKVPEIRLIVDWQDLWTYDPTYFNQIPRVYQQRLRNLEADIMAAADMNVTTNYKAEAVLRDTYHIDPQRLMSINHHFLETADYTQAPQQPLDLVPDGVNLGFLGTLFKPPKVPGERVLAALDQVAETQKLKLHLLGDVTTIAVDAIARLKHPCVQLYKRVSHDEAMRRVAACDALLITLSDLANCQVIMHGKLPHYLRLNRPIIALVPEHCFVAEVVRSTGAGVVLSNPATWAQELAEVVTGLQDKSLQFQPAQDRIARFGWQHAAGQWRRALG